MEIPDHKQKTSPRLRRSLGVFDSIAILIGITIGAGIYSTPQIIAQYQSSFSSIILMWIGGGVFVYIGGLIYAELGTRFPNTGGEYVYLSRAFGPFFGFLFGWAQLFIIRTSPAAGLAIITVDYFGHFIELTDFTKTGLSILVIALIGCLNYIGIKQASIYQNISTIIKMGGLFLLVAFGLVLMQGEQNLLNIEALPTEVRNPYGAFGVVMMLIVFSYLGWDRVGYAAGEMKDPKRSIPIAMFSGIALVVLTYVLANVLYHYVLGLEGVRGDKTVASTTAIELFGPIGASLIAISVMFSASGSINGTMMTAPRVYYAMARDKLFFSWFDFIHPTFRTPSRAIIAHCVWAVVILLVRRNFENIVAGMTFAVLIFYIFTTLAFFKFRRQNAGEKDGYKMPLYPVLPALYLIGLLVLVGVRGYFEWEKSLIDLAFMASGLPFALLFLKKRN